ncbi:MAG: alpha/beta hydrolase [Acidimicrobiia bacterium]|nr:alpha/beta hydrolase [Acidimicrobiia bacterium]
MTRSTEFLVNGSLRLALHTLAEGEGRPLLLLHGLGEQSPMSRPEWTSVWNGPVLALDFTGHGESDVPVSGGYTPEGLMSDVDAVLAERGPVTIVGRGFGSWVGLLVAGARTSHVHGVVLFDGSGAVGGGSQPPTPYVNVLPASGTTKPDPYALLELSRDPRPPDYALDYVRFILEDSEIENPIVVSARIRPEWLAAVASDIGVIELPLEQAIESFA